MKPLKQGDKFYKVDSFGLVQEYDYVCPLPKHENYHIVLKDRAYPERMYYSDFNKVFFVYEDAVKEGIRMAEHLVETLKDSLTKRYAM
ncbi:MAG: hypothetical protein UT21_C0006G0003 [Candidatus Woesebacteria bacterium GW2011_GWA1_39_11b]|nr:MAG: hypothetical protein UT21_C0006G0003 [Candidatus Woesebacteria bacterium GW2011_GWA1_39_11b]